MLPTKKRQPKKGNKSDGDKKNYCEICKRDFGRKSTKKKHDDTFHGDFLVVYSCGFCDLTSLNVKNIIAHHSIKHKDEFPIPNEKEIRWEKKKNSEQCE